MRSSARPRPSSGPFHGLRRRGRSSRSSWSTTPPTQRMACVARLPGSTSRRSSTSHAPSS
eukprot:4514124-Lingulodinium_polyedra.AAC.1